MRFVPFELERWQSTWENRVRYNLSESGVHPLSIQELLGLAGASPAPLLDVRLGYSQSNGTDLLRGRIAALYDGVSPDQILVTTGSAEANFVVCWRLVEPGDKVAVMLPNYLQTWGLAQNFGAEVRGFTLRAEAQWEPGPEEVRGAIAPGTKLVVVTNPHNPTGHVLSKEMRQAIVSRAAEHFGTVAAHPRQRHIVRTHVTRRNRHEAHVIRAGERQGGRRRPGSRGGPRWINERSACHASGRREKSAT